MQSVVSVSVNIFKQLANKNFTFLIFNHKPDLDYIKIISTFRNKPTEMWMLVTSVEPYTRYTWKANLIQQEPKISTEPIFQLKESYDEWF